VKLAALGVALSLLVPGMATAALLFPRVRGYLLSLMIFLTVLGSHGSLNLFSRELYRGPDRGFEFTAADLMCWALIVAMVVRFPRRIEWFPRNSWLLLLFFLNACLLAAVAAEPLFTAFSLWKCLRIFCLYWCTVNCLRLDTHRRYVWLGYAGAALVLSALAFEQKYLLGIYRVNGPFDHSNTIPLYANMLLPVLLIWGLCDRELPLWKSGLSIALSLGLLFAVICTFSRAGIAFAAGCFLCAVVWANVRSSTPRVRVTTLLLGLLMAGALIRVAGPILIRIQTAPKASEMARDEFNYAAQLMLRDHPFGVGLNNFSYVLTNQTQYRQHFEAMKNEEQAGVCHHIYWLTVAETGYIGLILYLLLIVRLCWSALRGAWRNKSIHGTLLFGVFLGFGALQASGFYEWAFRLTPVMQLFAIQAAVAVSWCVQRPQLRTVAAPAREPLTIAVPQESYS
jgi:O-Antigen ligase